MTDPGLTDLIAAHQVSGEPFYTSPPLVRWVVRCSCGKLLRAGAHPAHVALVVEQHTNGRIAELEAAIARVEKLAAEYTRDDQEHLNTFGQHHPVAGIAHDHLRAALEGEQQ